MPKEVLERYEKWKDIAMISGPRGLRFIKGFHDEALRGEWKGCRSSRLGLKYGVIYEITEGTTVIAVKKVRIEILSAGNAGLSYRVVEVDE